MLSDDDVKKIIEPRKATFTNCWREAFGDYVRLYRKTRPVHSPLARAVLLRDHCVDHVTRAFANDPEVQCRVVNGLFRVEISGASVGVAGGITCRLKKLNRKFQTSNIPTQQALDFERQVPLQGELFGEPLTKERPVHINIGYWPNELWTEPEAVYTTLPNGRRSIKWAFKISGDDEASRVVIEMPIQTVADEPKRVSLKKSQQK
jgi:hypothetical protein